eukprot:6172088-Pleurochrysis_carterae.AAC.4
MSMPLPARALAQRPSEYESHSCPFAPTRVGAFFTRAACNVVWDIWDAINSAQINTYVVVCIVNWSTGYSHVGCMRVRPAAGAATSTNQSHSVRNH